MEARDFIRSVVDGIAARTGGDDDPVPAGPAYLLDRVALAGFQFHEADLLWRNLALGRKVSLVRDPRNVHDANAVEVRLAGYRLGFVPRARNEPLARLMDQGFGAWARVSGLAESENPWERVTLDVMVTCPAGPAIAK